MSHRQSRREFLKASALVGAGFWVGPRLVAKGASPNEKLNVAVVGIEGQGRWNVGELAAAGANLVALCDVDEPRTAAVRAEFPKADFVVDYRRLLDRKDIDAVLIATPDHHHAPATMLALKAGKHVYCEKPLAHTVEEARTVAKQAVKSKLTTQMGTQIHAGSNYRRVVELIRAGAIGPIEEVHVWVGTVWGGQKRPPEAPVPEGLHWDLWLGPAPVRPYAKDVYVPAMWRSWWDFGGGGLADMACHHVDLSFWALDLRYPKTVAAEGPPVDADSCPRWMIVRYEFPARKDMPPVKLTWYHGGKRPPLIAPPRDSNRPRPAGDKRFEWGDGTLFIGKKGMLLAGYDNHKLLPEDDFKDFKPPEPSIPDSIGHHREWIEACKTGKPTTCNFDYSGALTEAVLLGNVAYRTGKRLEWDPAALKATNVPEADQYLQHKFREGWTL